MRTKPSIYVQDGMFNWMDRLDRDEYYQPDENDTRPSYNEMYELTQREYKEITK